MMIYFARGKALKKNGILNKSPFSQPGKITFWDIVPNNFFINNNAVLRNIFQELVPVHILNEALNVTFGHCKFKKICSGSLDYFDGLVAQRAAARAELEAIKRNTSWRLTYPVRLIGAIIKDVLAFARIIFNQIKYKNKKSLLVIDDCIPDPTLGYGYPRTYNILHILADLGYKVTFFPLRLPDKIEPYTSLLQQKGIEIICNPQNTKINFEIFFKNKKYCYDAIWISRPHNMREIAGIIKRVFPSQKIVYDAEALFSSRRILKSELQGVILSDQEKEKMINEEINLMRQADAVVTVSKAEKNIIKKHYDKEVGILGNCYDVNPTQKPFNLREGILFVGSFLDSTTPNEDAVHYFVNNIYPDVCKETNAKFFIVGTNYSESVKKLASKNIIVTGKVDDLYDYFNNCRVFVVPTRYSSGISLKLLESLSFGLPAVVTPLIANQLDIAEGVVLIGKNNDELIEKTIKCYKDNATWQSLREAGIKYIEDKCSPLAYKEKLNDIVQAIIN